MTQTLWTTVHLEGRPAPPIVCGHAELATSANAKTTGRLPAVSRRRAQNFLYDL